MSFDLIATAAEFLFRVGATSWTDLNWCSEPEIYGYFDEASQKLAEMGLFVARDTQTLAANTPAYALNAAWIDSMHVSVNGAQLRPASAAELLALDSTWIEMECETGSVPTRYSMDAGPLGTITLYPIPSGSAELETIDHTTAATIATTHTLAPVPSVLSDYFLYFALMRARGKESPYQMPEIAQAARAQVDLYEKVIKQYWGSPE